MRLTMLIKCHPTYDPTRHLRLAIEGDEESMIQTAAAASDVFGVLPYTETRERGLTVVERVSLMAAFDCYLMGVKKNIRYLPIWRRSMAAICPGLKPTITKNSQASVSAAVGS